jgi:hypothetical protein
MQKRQPDADGRLATMNPSAETAIKRRIGAGGMVYLLAAISVLLVLLIAADGVRKGLDTIVPDYYRHTASLAIALSEAAHGTTGMVGLMEVETALDKSGYGINPNRKLMAVLNAHPKQADAALRAAADLTIADRGKTFGLALNETGMIDYYYVAFKLFGYHVRSIYALYIGILAVMALCFIASFRRRAIFIVPSILFLLLLLIEQDALHSSNFDFGPLTNSRLLPFLSLYPVLYSLTLVGSGRGFRLVDAIGAAIAGLVFAFVVNARTYAYWQAGPPLALVVLIVAARLLPWRLPLRARLSRLSVYPVLVFVLSAAILIQNHHWRRDAVVYDTATFSGHGYWLAYVVTTMPSFQWRIPQLERDSGVTIQDSDAYAGALLRIKIKERGERLEDYLAGDYWNESKRDPLARQIVFDLWRHYPGIMIEHYLRALAPVGISLLRDLGLIALAVVAVGIGPHTPLLWLLRAAALIAIGGVAGAMALAAVGLPYVVPAARRLSALVIPVALLALFVVPTVIVMPFTDTRLVESASAFTDPRMADVNDAVWLCLLICACGARLQSPAAFRFRQNAASKKRVLPGENLSLYRPIE